MTYVSTHGDIMMSVMYLGLSFCDRAHCHVHTHINIKLIVSSCTGMNDIGLYQNKNKIARIITAVYSPTDIVCFV